MTKNVLLPPPADNYLIALCAAFPDEKIRALAFICIDHGAALEGMNYALLNAVIYGDGRLVEKMLDAGASVNFKNHAGDTPLSLSLENGNYAVAELILKRDGSLADEKGRHSNLVFVPSFLLKAQQTYGFKPIYRDT